MRYGTTTTNIINVEKCICPITNKEHIINYSISDTEPICNCPTSDSIIEYWECLENDITCEMTQCPMYIKVSQSLEKR